MAAAEIRSSRHSNMVGQPRRPGLLEPSRQWRPSSSRRRCGTAPLPSGSGQTAHLQAALDSSSCSSSASLRASRRCSILCSQQQRRSGLALHLKTRLSGLSRCSLQQVRCSSQLASRCRLQIGRWGRVVSCCRRPSSCRRLCRCCHHSHNLCKPQCHPLWHSTSGLCSSSSNRNRRRRRSNHSRSRSSSSLNSSHRSSSSSRSSQGACRRRCGRCSSSRQQLAMLGCQPAVRWSGGSCRLYMP